MLNKELLEYGEHYIQMPIIEVLTIVILVLLFMIRKCYYLDNCKWILLDVLLTVKVDRIHKILTAVLTFVFQESLTMLISLNIVNTCKMKLH